MAFFVKLTSHNPVPSVRFEIFELEACLPPRTILFCGFKWVAWCPRIRIMELVDSVPYVFDGKVVKMHTIIYNPLYLSLTFWNNHQPNNQQKDNLHVPHPRSAFSHFKTIQRPFLTFQSLLNYLCCLVLIVVDFSFTLAWKYTLYTCERLLHTVILSTFMWLCVAWICLAWQ